MLDIAIVLKKIPMAHTNAPNAALGNGVPSLATMKASLDARRPQGCPAGEAAAPARAARRRTPSAWLRPAARAQQGEGLHSAAVGRVRRRLVLRAPLPQGAAAWPAATCTSATSAPGHWQHSRTCTQYLHQSFMNNLNEFEF